MNLKDALALLDETEGAILSRPYLLEERGTYIKRERPCDGPQTGLVLRWFKHPVLATDWFPSPTELQATDWKVLSPDGKTEVTTNTNA